MSWLVLAAVLAAGATAVAIFITGGQRADTGESAKATAETKVVRIPVQGMTCAVCAANVKKALQSVHGVRDAEVDLEGREARVRYSAGKVSAAQFAAAINQLGYKAGTPVPEAPR